MFLFVTMAGGTSEVWGTGARMLNTLQHVGQSHTKMGGPTATTMGIIIAAFYS